MITVHLFMMLGVATAAPNSIPSAAPNAAGASTGPWWAATIAAIISAIASFVVIYMQSRAAQKLTTVNATLDSQKVRLQAQLDLDVGTQLTDLKAGLDNQKATLESELGKQTEVLKGDLQQKLERVKSDLTVSEGVRKQRLDDARKKEQLLVLLRDRLARDAKGQVLWLADNASRKGVRRRPALQKVLENNKPVWKETIYRLLVPLAAGDMLGKDLREVVPDYRVAAVRDLISCLLETFQSGEELAGLAPALPYKPGEERPDPKVVGTRVARDDLAVYVVQHVANLQPILATLQLRPQWSVVAEDAYLPRFSAEPDFDATIKEVGAIFTEFHPWDRPVTWRTIITQLFVYRALEAVMMDESKKDSLTLIDELTAAPKDAHLYDWRDRDLQTSVPSSSPALNPFEPAKAFVISRLTAPV